MKKSHAKYYIHLLTSYGDDPNPPPADPPPADPPTGTFTQDDVNRFVAEERRKVEGKFSKLVTEYDELKQSGVTPERLEEMSGKLKKLQTEFQTKEQQQKEAAKAKEAELTNKLKGLETEAKTFKDKYSNVVISNSLLEAATSSDKKPSNPKLIVELLRSKTTLEAINDETGSPTGEFAPKVSFDTIDDKGKPIQLALSPVDAVKRMAADTANYGSLFASSQRGGFNTGDHGGSPQAVNSMEDYQALRESGQHMNIGA